MVSDPDGERFAVTIATTIEDADVWIHDIPRGDWSRLAATFMDGFPVWWPDGEWIFFDPAEPPVPRSAHIPADGTGASELPTAGRGLASHGSISRDGGLLASQRLIARGDWDILILPLEGVARRGRLVPKDELLEAVWADVHVTRPQVAIKPALWHSGNMKTTLDLPDELMREIKIRAVKEDRKLKDAIADLLRRGLAHQDAQPETVRHRVDLPLVRCAHDARPDEEMTPERVARVLMEEETGQQ